VVSLLVSSRFLCAAVIVCVRLGVLVFGGVLELGSLRGTGRAGDVGDRREVIPVQAVAQTKDESGDQEGYCPCICFRHGGIIACRCNCAQGQYAWYLAIVSATVARSKKLDAWMAARDRLRARGLRWTPQRRLLLNVLADSTGHVTAAELIERCRAEDPQTIPSTVYRTLDVLEEIGLVRHGHGADGREQFHVLPEAEHGHLHCRECGTSWEIEVRQAESLVTALARERGFTVDLSHLTVVGTCANCGRTT